MMEHADALIAYRTYPHVDMADTGRACARHLALMLKTKARFAKAFRQLPFLIPISWQCTNDQPTKGIYQKLAALESDAVPTLSFAPGFPAADFRDCGPSVFAYGRTQADADAAADRIVALVESHEDDFDGRIYSPDDGVRLAMELAKIGDQADRHRRHPGQSRRRRRFRHHGHAARAGAQQGAPRRHRRDLRSAIGQRRACGRRRRHGHAGSRRQVRHIRRCALQGNLRRRKTVRRKVRGDRPLLSADATWIWDRRPACASATSAWSSAPTRRSSRISRCTAMSASSRPNRKSWSTRARCISAPISSRSPKSS